MIKIVKITVNGWIENSFEGSEDEALIFLKNLKQLQFQTAKIDLPNELIKMNQARAKYREHFYIHEKYKYEKTQKPFQKYGLKIKIETINH